MTGPRRLLAIHQGAELYGSDRSFAQSIAAFRRAWPDAIIDIRLGGAGPLQDLLAPHADGVVLSDLWIARKSGALRQALVAAPRFLGQLRGRLAEMRRYDLVYINTIVPLDYTLPTLWQGGNTVIHVREIPPVSILGRLLRGAIRRSRAGRLFNSSATARAYGLEGAARSAVVLNGVTGPETATPPALGDTVTLALIGRINDWKGQDLALDAIAALPPAIRRRLRCRIIGSPFAGQGQVMDRLAAEITRHGLDRTVSLVPFHPDMATEYRDADLVLVPSRRPEPFGRVAIEAMAHGRAVIAADHGGLSEIVEHGQSGIKVRPNDAAALSAAIAALIDRPDEIRRLGHGARARYEAMFTEAAMERALIGAIKSLVPAMAG